MALVTRRTDPIYAGETWQEDLQIKDDAGLPLDLTGASVRVVLLSPGKTTPALEGNVGSGVTITDPTTGVITWLFSSAATGSLCSGVYTVRVYLNRAGVTTVVETYRLPILEGVQ
jgi:hypothetical protein